MENSDCMTSHQVLGWRSRVEEGQANVMMLGLCDGYQNLVPSSRLLSSHGEYGEGEREEDVTRGRGGEHS